MNLHDIETIESDEETTIEEYYIAIQRAINSGTAWSFQGSYGRAMMEAIKEGSCMLGRDPARDYWGNRIPSRDEVKEGTKGSYEYCAHIRGTEWADMMERV